MMGFQRVLRSIGQIAEQMKTVSDLNCVWRSAPRSICVPTSTVTTNELDPGMSLQPCDERVRLTVRQQIDGTMLL